MKAQADQALKFGYGMGGPGLRGIPYDQCSAARANVDVDVHVPDPPPITTMPEPWDSLDASRTTEQYAFDKTASAYSQRDSRYGAILKDMEDITRLVAGICATAPTKEMIEKDIRCIHEAKARLLHDLCENHALDVSHVGNIQNVSTPHHSFASGKSSKAAYWSKRTKRRAAVLASPVLDCRGNSTDDSIQQAKRHASHARHPIDRETHEQPGREQQIASEAPIFTAVSPQQPAHTQQAQKHTETHEQQTALDAPRSQRAPKPPQRLIESI